MATCKYCSKSGWLVGVDELGLCNACHTVHHADIMKNCRLYTSSVSSAVRSKNPSVTLNKLLVAGMCCQALQKYEEKGIPTLGMSTQSALQLLEASFAAAVHEATKQIVDAARQKAQTAASDAGRLGAYSTAADRLLKLASEFTWIAAFQQCVRDLQVEQDSLRVDLLLKRSDVAEAKGQIKKAIDYAIDALMCLRHDTTPDDLQVDMECRVTSRIKALGGTVPIRS